MMPSSRDKLPKQRRGQGCVWGALWLAAASCSSQTTSPSSDGGPSAGSDGPEPVPSLTSERDAALDPGGPQLNNDSRDAGSVRDASAGELPSRDASVDDAGTHDAAVKILDSGVGGNTEGRGGSGAGGGVAAGGAAGMGAGAAGAGGFGGEIADPLPSGPLEAEAETWTWMPLESMRCANGTTTGFGVNLSADSDELMLFLDGSGGCVNLLSCLQLDVTTGFDGDDFSARLEELATAGYFQRNAVDNPFAQMSWIYVPYCTGDVHAGNHLPSGITDLAFVGHHNMLALQTRLRSAFEALERVVVVGGSAGGIGALFNYHDLALTFAEAEVSLLDDGGPLLGPEWMTPSFQQSTFGTWEIEGTIPEQCTNVAPGSLHELYACLATLHPNARFGLATTDGDPVVRDFLGGPTGTLSVEDYQLAVADLTARLGELPQWKLFVYPSSTEHVLGFNEALDQLRVPNDESGVSLSEFAFGVATGVGFGDASVAK